MVPDVYKPSTVLRSCHRSPGRRSPPLHRHPWERKMPHATSSRDATHAVVFSPLDASGRAELVEQRLTDAIVAGVLRHGERLPSESDLANSLGVAVVTAREALEGMREKGLVKTRRGREGGSFVTYDRDAARTLV